ncbi:MAG: SRPBCC family protein [Myxococcales bacterium]|nr:SRPBCC family protein [Myxococcales bacterium]
MVEVRTEREFEVDAKALWAILADFGDIRWIPGIEQVELEGEGVGMVRHVTAPGMPQLHERLDAIDHATMTLDYSLPAVAYLQVRNYRARARVVALAAGRCRLVWSCRAEADAVDEAQATANTEAFYAMVMTWIRDFLDR